MNICMENMEAIMEAYMPLIISNARKFSSFEFDEVVDESRMILIDAIGDYDESRGSFGNFLKLRLRYHFLDMAKKAPVDSLDDLDSSGTPLIDGLVDDYDFEQDLLKNEDYALLYDAMNRLSELDRKIVWLKYIYSYPNAEVADIMGLSYKTVANRSSLALKKLREILS